MAKKKYAEGGTTSDDNWNKNRVLLGASNNGLAKQASMQSGYYEDENVKDKAARAANEMSSGARPAEQPSSGARPAEQPKSKYEDTIDEVRRSNTEILKRPIGKKSGGAIKSSASNRADGIAQRGKTRGKYC